MKCHSPCKSNFYKEPCRHAEERIKETMSDTSKKKKKDNMLCLRSIKNKKGLSQVTFERPESNKADSIPLWYFCNARLIIMYVSITRYVLYDLGPHETIVIGRLMEPCPLFLNNAFSLLETSSTFTIQPFFHPSPTHLTKRNSHTKG